MVRGIGMDDGGGLQASRHNGEEEAGKGSIVEEVKRGVGVVVGGVVVVMGWRG